MTVRFLLPDGGYVTAVEAISYIALGSAIPCSVMQNDPDEIAREFGEDWRNRIAEAEQALFEACRQNVVQLFGRRQRHEVETPGDPEPFPPYFSSAGVMLDITRNEILPRGERGDFAEFERDITLSIWVDAMISVEDVRRLACLQTRPSTSTTESKCRRWLMEEMRASERPPRAKKHYYEKAKELFGVGVVAFKRAWADAIRETKREQWSKAGRKPTKSADVNQIGTEIKSE